MAGKKSAGRRGNNEGSIYQRPDGIWVAQVNLGTNPETGKRMRKSVYGKTRSEVATQLNYLVGHVSKYGIIKESKDALEPEMRKWLMTYKKAEVTSRTFESCMRAARLYVFPNIGQMPINRIGADIIQYLLTKTLHDKQKLSVATVKKAQFLLNQFFDYLKRENIVGENPVKNTVIKPNEEEKIKAARYKAIRPENRRDFFKAISTHPLWKPLCLTILFSSPRIGEILALKWRNLELDNPDYQGITIDSAVTIKYSFDDYGNVIKRERIIGTTKTAASERENPLPDIAVEALKEYKKYRALQASIYGYPYVGDDDFVFGNDKGQLRSYSGIRHMFTRFMKRHGLGNLNIHFHTLRHTFSNMLFESHENPKTIQALMGHKSEQTTKKTYHSVDRAQLNAATRTLNKLTKQSGFEM